VTGTASPLGGGPAAVGIRFAPQSPGRTGLAPEQLGERCRGGALIDASSPAFGLAHPVAAAPRSVRAERLFVGDRRLSVPATLAPGVVPGLSVVGPSAEASWPPGYYRLVVETTGGEASLVLCLGEVGAAGSSVDPATASEEAYTAAHLASTR
jgi:hypothetical protein